MTQRGAKAGLVGYNVNVIARSAPIATFNREALKVGLRLEVKEETASICNGQLTILEFAIPRPILYMVTKRLDKTFCFTKRL